MKEINYYKCIILNGSKFFTEKLHRKEYYQKPALKCINMKYMIEK